MRKNSSFFFFDFYFLLGRLCNRESDRWSVATKKHIYQERKRRRRKIQKNYQKREKMYKKFVMRTGQWWKSRLSIPPRLAENESSNPQFQESHSAESKNRTKKKRIRSILWETSTDDVPLHSSFFIFNFLLLFLFLFLFFLL